jgi:hypothetical protein
MADKMEQNEVDAVLNNPDAMKEIKQNTQAWLDGKSKSLSQVMADKVTWQDTLLTDDELRQVTIKARIKAKELGKNQGQLDVYFEMNARLEAQAKATWEVAFKAGQKSGRQEVVDWVKDNHAFNEWGDLILDGYDFKNQKKEWGYD